MFLSVVKAVVIAQKREKGVVLALFSHRGEEYAHNPIALLIPYFVGI